MYKDRTSPEFEKAMKAAKKLSNITRAIALLGPWIDKPIKQELVPVKFDKDTGKPTKHEWRYTDREWHRWDGSLRGDGRLLRSLEKLLKPGEVHVEPYSGGFYVIDHVPVLGNERGSAPAHFLLRKAV